MGLHVSVYRWNLGDCTNHGISSKADGLTIVNIDGPSTPMPGQPAAMLVLGPYNTPRIVPAIYSEIGEYIPEPRWTMMGGNYAATSDSRFGEALKKLLGHGFYGAVAIHDRIE